MLIYTTQLKTDTLEILSKVPYAKRLKRQQEEYDKWVKKQEKKADKPSKNKNSAKAKKQQLMPSEQE